jgi:hypothetical protein
MAITTWSKDIILCLIAIKTITPTNKILRINYGFKDLKVDIQTNNVSISISLGFQNSVKTVCLLV